MKLKCIVVPATTLLLSFHVAAATDEARIRQLEERVQKLEALVLPASGEMQARNRATNNRAKFEARLEQDAKTYTLEERREIETLYQVANKQWRSPEAQESLKKLIGKYSKANRTGCAVLYLGQMTEGTAGEDYLRKAAAEFEDCWYGDGVQVGAYARYVLAFRLDEAGKKDEAAKLVRELREKYPDAIDHKGNLLADKMPK